ncbi:hypothetical protein RUM44_001617 [Polyplax serrata]|uniref:Uncharacterized protein n=1 Tax=Polyplax serrata TaxID=468196 RepID=A0ABR1AKJ7_POLSC
MNRRFDLCEVKVETNEINNKEVKEQPEKQRRQKHLSPERDEPCNNLNEPRNKTQDWARKLVGSIRRKVSTKKGHTTGPNFESGEQHEEGGSHETSWHQEGSPSLSQEVKVEAVKKTFTDLEEFKLSPKMGTRESHSRKMSLTNPNSVQVSLERKYSQRGPALSHQGSLVPLDEPESGTKGARSTTDNVNFEKCKIRRKLSFPSTSTGEATSKPEMVKLPKKKDTTLLALIFKKQASVDVKKEKETGDKTAAEKDKEKEKMAKERPRKIPDFSFSNSGSPGADFESREDLVQGPDFKCGSDIGLSRNELKTGFNLGHVGSTPKTMSRSCGQVEIISSDPAVRENFLRATMSIFLAVSPPSSKMQVFFRGKGFEFTSEMGT